MQLRGKPISVFNRELGVKVVEHLSR
jgi:hypothetical protein